MDERKQDQLVELLDKARVKAEALVADENTSEIDIVKAMDSIVKTGVAIVGVQQRDDHKQADLDEPKAAADVTVNVQQNQVIKVEFDRGG